MKRDLHECGGGGGVEEGSIWGRGVEEVPFGHIFLLHCMKGNAYREASERLQET